MEPTFPIPDAETLLRDAAWLRSLARRLVVDESRADDAVQDAWLSALRHPPRDGPARGWWAVVLRNAVRQVGRSEASRARRERCVAREAFVVASPDDVVARAETHEGLVQAVLALDEPYRRVLLWRYFDEAQPVEIARRLGVPAGTVRSQIKRGLERLRHRLQTQHHGDAGAARGRSGWALALVPLAQPAPATHGALVGVMGGLAVKLALKIGAVVLLSGLLLFGVWAALSGPEVQERSEDSATDTEHAARPASGVAAAHLEGRTAAEERAATPSPAALPTTTEREPWVATGIVRSAGTGTPIAGARVRARMIRGSLEEPLGTAHTDTEGRFALDLRSLAERPRFVVGTALFSLRVGADGHAPLRAGLRAEDEAEPGRWQALEIELEPGPVIRGRVIDARGAAVVSAQILLSRLDRLSGPHALAHSDTDGRFEAGLEAGVAYTGRAEKEGVGTASIERFTVTAMDALDCGDVRLLGPGTIAGVLRYPDGTPAAYAKAAAWAVPEVVELGDTPDASAGLLTTRALADEKGRFVLRGLAPGRYYVADAAERPMRTARAQPGAWPVCATGEEGVSVVVRGHRVVLRIRDEDENPLPGATYAVNWRTPEATDIEDTEAGRLQNADGILTLRGRPGERMEVNVTAGDSAPAEFVLEVREDVWHVQEDLVLARRSAETGTLHIASLLDDRDQRIQAALVTISTLKSDALVHYNVPLPDDGRLTGLAVGTYRLEVIAGRTHRYRSDELWFPLLSTFEIQADTETSVDLRARPGARIRLTVHASGMETGSKRALDGLRAFVLPAEGAERVSLGSFLTDRPGGWSTGNPQPGVPGLAWRLLESGPYTLHIELDGYRPIRREVRLDAGKVLDVELTLEED